MDSNWVLECVMEAEGRDPAIAKRIKDLFDAIDDDRIEEAKGMIAALRADIGNAPGYRRRGILHLADRAPGRRGGRVRFIKKGSEPAALRKFKAANKRTSEVLTYSALPADVRSDLYASMLMEQGKLCAYTMMPIGRLRG